MLNWIHNQQQYKIPISISKKLNPIKSSFLNWQLNILKTSEKQVLCVCKLDWTVEYAGQMQIQHWIWKSNTVIISKKIYLYW